MHGVWYWVVVAVCALLAMPVAIVGFSRRDKLPFFTTCAVSWVGAHVLLAVLFAVWLSSGSGRLNSRYRGLRADDRLLAAVAIVVVSADIAAIVLSPLLGFRRPRTPPGELSETDLDIAEQYDRNWREERRSRSRRRAR